MVFIRDCENILVEYLRTLYGEGNYNAWMHQRETWKCLYEDAGEKVILLRVPTAGGKTESVLIPYFYQYVFDDWFLAPGLIYVLPNKTLLFSQYQRIMKMRDIICPSKRISVVADLGGIYPGKTFLFGDIVLTTLDAFVYGLMAKRTILLDRDENLGKTLFPIGNIATSIVVFDEVQMYQDSSYYTPRILGKIINILYRSGVPVVIMTATMPEVLKKSLIPETVEYVTVYNSKVKRGKVSIHLKTDIKLLDFIMFDPEFKDILHYYRRILVVVNTVGKAVQIYRALRGVVEPLGFEIDLIHGRLLEATRRGRESKLEDLKNSDIKYILVATQVAESGLDLDFHVVLTELAPIDGLIQRLGRAARRISEGIGYVFGAESNRPYSGEILDRTLNAIEPSRLEAALMDLRDTDALLNQVFMEMPSLPKHLVGIYNKTRASIESLSPFINFSCLRARVRPELYITVLVLENVNCDELRKIGGTAELHLPYVVVRDNHMNVQFIGTDLEMYPYLKFGDFALKVDLERSFLSNNHVLLKISKAPRIFPQNLYLANPNYYVEEKNYDLGLMFRGEENA